MDYDFFGDAHYIGQQDLIFRNHGGSAMNARSLLGGLFAGS
jgi:hypothetical protein